MLKLLPKIGGALALAAVVLLGTTVYVRGIDLTIERAQMNGDG